MQIIIGREEVIRDLQTSLKQKIPHLLKDEGYLKLASTYSPGL
jgi:hypothetical protein